MIAPPPCSGRKVFKATSYLEPHGVSRGSSQSKTVQTDTLYRGIHVDPSFLRKALETGRIKTNGLVSTSASEDKARPYALKTEHGEVSVILELPPSLKMKTLELDGESLLSTHRQFGVKSVTVDADGIYHVQLKAKAGSVAKPIADDSIYDQLGAAKPGQTKISDVMTEQEYQAICQKAIGKSSIINTLELYKALEYVYPKFGYESTVRLMEKWAESKFEDYDNKALFDKADCGYSKPLLCAVHEQWVGSSTNIRSMESKDLTPASSGSDIKNKIYDDAFNALVKRNGGPQPSMLYRGLHGALTELRSAQPGEIVTLKGIASFSAKKEVAEKQFAGQNGVVLQVPENVQAQTYYVHGQNEAEWLLTDDEYRVVKREQKRGRLYLTIELSKEKTSES